MSRPLNAAAAVLGLAVFAAGCGPRASSSSSSSSTTGTSAQTSDGTGEDTASGSGVVAPPMCDAPEQACGSECIDPATLDLQDDNDHCGEFCRACDWGGRQGGECFMGKCLSTYSPCIQLGDAAQNCNEVCAHSGRECEDRTEKIHPNMKWGETCPESQYVFEDLERCEAFLPESEKLPAACDEPFQWDYDLAGKLPTALRCCCKQDW